MGSHARIRNTRRRICTALATTLLLTIFLSVSGLGIQGTSQPQAKGETNPPGPLVIQGRITKIEGAVVTVKTPDLNPPLQPGGGGPLFIVAGPRFRVDVSSARILMPDGKKIDTQPLAVNDRVLMVLSGADAASPEPRNLENSNHIYSASIIEHLAHGDVLAMH